MKYVYVLQSEQHPERLYTGVTSDLKRRLQEHYSGSTGHTFKYHPWCLKVYVAFADPLKAEKFEAYLRSGSGRAFVKRHF